MKQSLALVVALAAGLWPAAARAGKSFAIAAAPGSGVSIQVESLYDELLPLGFQPLAVTIQNDLPYDGRWRLELESRRSYGPSPMHSEKTLSVPARTTRRFLLYVALPASGASQSGYMSLHIAADGPGVHSSDSQNSQVADSSAHPGATIGIASSFSASAQDLKERGSSAHAVVFEPNALPDDVRGLLGLDAIWIGMDALAEADPAAQRAIVEWVSQGGELLLVADAGQPLMGPLSRAELELGYVGLGRVQRVPAVELSGNALELAAQHPARVAVNGKAADFLTPVGPLPVHRGPIILFLLLFLIAVGPVNFIVLAKPAQRHRLLFTTPLISLAASVSVLVVILLGDGLGGEGRRAQVLLLLPERHSEWLFQADAMRTGMVRYGGFRLPDGALIEQIRNSRARDRALEREEGGVGGPWFVSRDVRGYMIELMRPSRARILVREQTGAVRLRAELGQRLAEVWYVAHDGRRYRAEGVEPGAEVSMSETTTTAFTLRMYDLAARQHCVPSELVLAMRDRPGWFFAVPAQPSALMLPTRPEITWRDDVALIVGPALMEASAR